MMYPKDKRIKWKTIEEFKKYEVSNIGEVRHKRSGRIRKPVLHKHGYYHINFDIIPSLEIWYQRLERTFRLDSKNNKIVYNLIGDVIEDRIFRILKKKTKLFDAIVEGKVSRLENVDIKKEVLESFVRNVK